MRSRSAPQGLVRRARIVLASAVGASNTAIAREVGLSIPAVGHWRKRFLEQGLAGLYGEQRPGRPRDHDDESVRACWRRCCGRPSVGTDWPYSARPRPPEFRRVRAALFAAVRGPSAPRQDLQALDRPAVRRKVRDIVGLYLNPPDHAVVLCVDEKSQIQALERTQPVLPMGFGYVDGITHDYKRHGTTTLFAALDIANGQVLAQCKARHRHQEFLAFLKRIDAAVPAGLDVHLIVDNYATHKHPKVRAWLAQRARFHVHYTPTYASWLNQVERWFAILTSREIRRGSFASAKDLVARITAFVAAYNTRSQPFA